MDKVLAQFLAAAEQGSITKAAASLFMSQPSVTSNLKKLEDSLGVRLFERTARGVKLTRYGDTLYENVAIMQRLYNNALESIERQRLQYEVGLSIGSGYSWWSLFLKDLMVAYNDRHPEAPLNVVLGNALRCMDQLVAGDISLFIGHRIENLFGGVHADFIEIGSIRDGFFVRRGHPLDGVVSTQKELLKYSSTIAFPPEARQQRLLLERAESHAPERQPEYMERAFTSNSLEACLDFVLSTNAVLRHTNLIRRQFEAKGLVMIELAPGEETQFQPFGIYVLSERRSDKRIAGLIDHIRRRANAVLEIADGR